MIRDFALVVSTAARSRSGKDNPTRPAAPTRRKVRRVRACPTWAESRSMAGCPPERRDRPWLLWYDGGPEVQQQPLLPRLAPRGQEGRAIEDRQQADAVDAGGG